MLTVSYVELLEKCRHFPVDAASLEAKRILVYFEECFSNLKYEVDVYLSGNPNGWVITMSASQRLYYRLIYMARLA